MAGEDVDCCREGAKGQDEMTLPPYFYDTPEPAEGQRASWLVTAIVIVNVGVFAVVMYVNNCPARAGGGRSCFAGFLRRFSYQPLRENPLLGPSSSTLENFGALQWDKIVHRHQGWRLVSSIWLHGGIIHLLVDSSSLIFIGIRLEQQFGCLTIGVIYLVSGICGNVLSSLFITNGISIGASGALFGLLGAMLSELITNWTIYSNRAAAATTLLIIIIINLVIGILPLVNNFAHIGGFISGFLLGFVLLMRPQINWIEHQSPPSEATSKYNTYQRALWLMAIFFLIVGFVIGLVMLFSGVNVSKHCHWCSYLNCVPTSKWSCGN